MHGAHITQQQLHGCTQSNAFNSVITTFDEQVPELEQQEPGIYGELVDVGCIHRPCTILFYLHALITRRECVCVVVADI